MPDTQWLAGRTVRIVPVESQVSRISVDGVTVNDAPTLRGSMASLNVMSTAAWRSIAAPIERNACSGRAVIVGAGWVAVVPIGRDRPRAATRTMTPTLATSPTRAATERRARTGR